LFTIGVYQLFGDVAARDGTSAHVVRGSRVALHEAPRVSV